MKNIFYAQKWRKFATFLTLVLFAVLIFGLTVNAQAPGLDEVINGATNVENSEQSSVTAKVEKDGVLPSVVIDVKDIYNGKYTENTEIAGQFKTVLGQGMGTVLPILIGVISACLVLVMLLDLLYIVAPFVRSLLAPNAQNSTNSDMNGGMQQNNMYQQNGGNHGRYGQS